MFSVAFIKANQFIRLVHLTSWFLCTHISTISKNVFFAGSLRLWDCISSHLLKSYNPAVTQMSHICDVAYQVINGTKYIFAATSSRSVRVYEVGFY